MSDKTQESIETSSLHLDLLSELKRINSLICAIAYPILESSGALAPNRLRPLAEAEILADIPASLPPATPK